MNKMKFYEAIYASCSNIIARRKGVALPLLVIVLGVVLPMITMNVWSGAEYDDINSAVILLGIALAVAGGIWLLGRTIGHGLPYDTQRSEFLETKIISFDRSRRKQVVDAVESGAVDALLSIPACDVSALCVILAMRKDNSIVAAQVFEYAELEYRQLSEVKIMKK